MNFKHWLLKENAFSRLAIFDFDATLADTPHPPEGWKGGDYLAPDGKKKKTGDWWTHPDSLKGDWGFNQKVLVAFEQARRDPNTHAVMMTGRVGMRTAHTIRGRLRDLGMYGRRVIPDTHPKAKERHEKWPHGDDHSDDSHDEYYKGDGSKEPGYPQTEKGHPSSDTFDHKSHTIEHKLMNLGIQEIEFWDDKKSYRQGFIDLFQRLLREWPNLQHVVIHVVSPQGVSDINLQKEGLIG